METLAIDDEKCTEQSTVQNVSVSFNSEIRHQMVKDSIMHGHTYQYGLAAWTTYNTSAKCLNERRD
jgi:hypothetical protein